MFQHVKTTSQFILIKRSPFGSNHGTVAIHQQHQRIPHHQAIASTLFLQKLIKNSPRCIQSSSSPTPHHPKFTSVIHRRFGSDNSTSTIHQQIIPHHQAIAPISIPVEIARELAKTHPIKLEPSHTPPKIHIDQTSTFRKQSRRRRHSPSTPNNPSPSGYYQHSNYHENCLRTCEDTLNQARAFPRTSQNSP